MGVNTVDVVRFGLVGCGAISTHHIDAINAVEGSRLVAVASASVDRARATGEQWGVPCTTQLDELLTREDVDAVAICTPSGLHADQALAALRHGKHVLVEKPLALSVSDANRVIAEGRRQRRWVGTISQRRFAPIMDALHRAITAGAFGRIALVVGEGLYHRPQSYYDSAPWRGTRALDGGVLMNQAIHMVDLVCWLGGAVSSVSGHLATLGHQMEAEDTATVSLRFASGALGELLATTCAEPGFEPELRVYGDAGHVRIVGEEPVEWNLPMMEPPLSIILDDGAAADSSGTVIRETDGLGHIRQYADFVAAIRDEHPPAVTGDDGRRAVEVVTAAYEADRTGRAVAIPDGQ